VGEVGGDLDSVGEVGLGAMLRQPVLPAHAEGLVSLSDRSYSDRFTV